MHTHTHVYRREKQIQDSITENKVEQNFSPWKRTTGESGADGCGDFWAHGCKQQQQCCRLEAGSRWWSEAYTLRLMASESRLSWLTVVGSVTESTRCTSSPVPSVIALVLITQSTFTVGSGDVTCVRRGWNWKICSLKNDLKVWGREETISVDFCSPLLIWAWSLQLEAVAVSTHLNIPPAAMPFEAMMNERHG